MASAGEPIINRTVLMSGTEYFDTASALNPYMQAGHHANRKLAQAELAAIRSALEQAGVRVLTTSAPPNCQDGVFTANWGLCRGDTVVLSSLPLQRAPEMPYAKAALEKLGKHTIAAPFHFSGQGDALTCGELLFAGSRYRTDPRVHNFLKQELGYQVVGLEPMPELDELGRPIINAVTGWPDSFFYDLDLAICVIKPSLIGWCPEAFTPESQDQVRALSSIDKIEISKDEAVHGFACNSVSTGQVVIMNANAPRFKAEVEAHGLEVVTISLPELAKGGGGIRCVTLTLDND